MIKNKFMEYEIAKKLTKAEKKALVKEICRLCEKQYRKGYAHGYFQGKDKLVNDKDVNNFRFEGLKQKYSKVVHPPNFKSKESPIQRVSYEIEKMAILDWLFDEVEKMDK